MCDSGSPLTQMTPPLMVSRVISSRRIVVLPDPLGPMSVTRSPGWTEKSSSLSTMLLPYRLTTLSKRISSPPGVSSADCTPAVSVMFLLAVLSDCCITALQTSDDDRGRHTHGQEEQPCQGVGLHAAEGLGADRLGHEHHLGHGDSEQVRRVLEHG